TVTGVSGYFGLTFAASNLGYGLNNFYYLRNDPVTGTVKFGTLAPALLGLSADQFDIGNGGFTSLTFTGDDVGYGVNKMYYTRLDPITGYTILGMLNPALGGTRRTSDIANLGSVYTTLNYVPGDVGFGAMRFYTTGSINSDAQTVSFAAIANRSIATGSFTVNPTASSALPITLTVVPGSVGNAIISAPIGGVFTITPTAPGLITLQAAQAGAVAPIPYAYNMLRQSFTISGTALVGISTQPVAQSVATGGNAILTVVAEGPSPTYQWRKEGIAIPVLNASATTATLTLTNVQPGDAAVYDVVVTNASGSIPSDPVTLTVTAPAAVAPVITNSPLTASGTVQTPFTYTITASNSPTSFNASPLPAGLSINTLTGVISGTPTASGTFLIDISATNTPGTGTATLTLNVSNTVEVVVNGPIDSPIILTPDGLPPPAGTVYTAKGLPAGFVLDPVTGQITRIPGSTATGKPGTYVVTYYTITTNEDGSKTKGPVQTLRIVINPLPAGLSGNFESIVELFPAPNSPEGKVELLVNASTGAFTGKLTHSSQAKAYSFKGVLSVASGGLSGTGSVTIKRSGNNPFRLDFLIDSQAVADQVLLASLQQLDGSGNVVETVAESTSGGQIARFSNSSPAPWQGAYTMVLSDPTAPPFDMGVTLAPEGTGFGLVTISASSGIMVVKGTLGDGTPLTASLSPSADGSYRWYVKPYKKTGGFFGGWTQFTPVSGDEAPYEVATAANSELYWSKSASNSKDKSYRAGFGPVFIIATAQRWLTPAAGTTLSALLQLSDSSVLSSFTSDELSGPDALIVPSSLGLNDLNKFVVLAPAANSSGFTAKARAFDGTFTRTNGLFTGSFTLQDGRKVPVNGVLLQQPVVGAGSVIGEGLFVIPPAIKGGEAVTGKVQFLAPAIAP
ncbi:MAG: immunoglobulin domain-containing protein, partial [Opitutaceae bacterium]|nr:immunoglobulin domain-containing protein [Opitutaceae bacterium]